MVSKASKFIFTQYAHSLERNNELTFSYTIEFEGAPSLDFTETISLPQKIDRSRLDNDVLERLLQGLHLIIGISYWKLHCAPQIEIANYSLTEDQAAFWNTIYTKGLGEFFYKNNIDFKGLVQFPFANVQATEPFETKSHSNEMKQALVGVGGGKDSIVAAELVKSAGIPFETWHLSHPLQETIAKKLSSNPLAVKRTVDPKVSELVTAGTVYNGHIPISAIYALIGLFLGMTHGYEYLIFGNERSSNYGNVSYLGEEINHQWSKSAEFENLFRKYVREFITPGVKFFSFMRPFYEIEIVRRFVQFPQYFNEFSSCNRNFTTKDPLRDTLWCGECPKCAFVFCLMSAFLPKAKLIEIFGANLYEKESLLDTYRELQGIKDVKPFECVGTPDETKVAFYRANATGDYEKDVVTQMFVKDVLPTISNIQTLETEVFSYGDDSNIPEDLRKVLTDG